MSSWQVFEVDAVALHVFSCYAAGLKYHLDRYRVFGPWQRFLCF